jgi:hypothetical protein
VCAYVQHVTHHLAESSVEERAALVSALQEMATRLRTERVESEAHQAKQLEALNTRRDAEQTLRMQQLLKTVSSSLTASSPGGSAIASGTDVTGTLANALPKLIAPALYAATMQHDATLRATLSEIVEAGLFDEARVQQLADAVSEAVLKSLVTSLDARWKTMFEQRLIPSFEKGTQSMFNQIVAALNQVTTGVTASLSKAEQSLAHRPAAAAVPTSPSSPVAAAASAADIQTLMQMMVEMRGSLSTLTHHVQSLEVHVRQLGQQQERLAAAVAAGGVFEEDLRPELDELVQAQAYEQAFTKALSSNASADLLPWLCTRVNRSAVFVEEATKLPAHLTFSLVQQLSTILDVQEHVSLLLDFMQDGLVTLPQGDSQVALMYPSYLPDVIDALTTVNATHPDPTIKMKAQLVKLVANSHLSSVAKK